MNEVTARINALGDTETQIVGDPVICMKLAGQLLADSYEMAMGNAGYDELCGTLLNIFANVLERRR